MSCTVVSTNAGQTASLEGQSSEELLTKGTVVFGVPPQPGQPL